MAPIGTHYPINHVIIYVPSLYLYLDSTDTFAPLGRLPLSDRDKPVILTALDRLGRTPRMKADDHLSRTEVHMTIRADGTISGRSYEIPIHAPFPLLSLHLKAAATQRIYSRWPGLSAGLKARAMCVATKCRRRRASPAPSAVNAEAGSPA